MSVLTKVDHVLGPESGVAVEPDGTIGLGNWVQTGLQDVPQLEGDLEQTEPHHVIFTLHSKIQHLCRLYTS